LFFNRYNQYQANISSLGMYITYTDVVVEKAKNRLVPQILVSIYALTYAILGTVYFFKKQKEPINNIKVLSDLFELKEKGAITVEEYEAAKHKIIN
jgi:hypothetical protein